MSTAESESEEVSPNTFTDDQRLLDEMRKRLILREQPGQWVCNRCAATQNQDCGLIGRGAFLIGNEDADTLRYRICTSCQRWRVAGLPKRGYCIDCVDERERWVRQTQAWPEAYVTARCLGCRKKKTVIQPIPGHESETESASDSNVRSDREIFTTTPRLLPVKLAMRVDRQKRQRTNKAECDSHDVHLEMEETSWERLHVITEINEARRRGWHFQQRNERSTRKVLFVHYVQQCECAICDGKRKEAPHYWNALESLESTMPPLYWHSTHDCRCVLCHEIHYVITPVHLKHLSTTRYDRIASAVTDRPPVQPKVVYNRHSFATCNCEFCTEGGRRLGHWNNSEALLSVLSVR